MKIVGITKINMPKNICSIHGETINPYLVTKYGAKLVTDAQGVTWNEVTITPDMAGPVLAFKQNLEDAHSGPMADPTYVRQTVASFADRLKLDINVHFVDKIYTGEKSQAVFAMSGEKDDVEAWAATLGREIVFDKNGVPNYTAAHEVLHFIVNNLDDMEADFGVSRLELLTAQNGGKLPRSRAEEQRLGEELSHGFEKAWRASQEGKAHGVHGVVGRFFDRLIAFIKQMLAIPRSNEEIIHQFYDKALYMKRRGATVTDRAYNLGRFETAPGVLNFGVKGDFRRVILEGREGQIDYNKWGKYARIAYRSKTFPEFVKNFIAEEGGLYAYGKDTVTKIDRGTQEDVVRREFRKMVNMSMEEFYANAQTDIGFMRKENGERIAETAEEWDSLTSEEQTRMFEKNQIGDELDRELSARALHEELRGDDSVWTPMEHEAERILNGKEYISIPATGNLVAEAKAALGKMLYARTFRKDARRGIDDFVESVRNETGDREHEMEDLLDALIARSEARKLGAMEIKAMREKAREARKKQVEQAKTDKEKLAVIKGIERDLLKKLTEKRYTLKRYVAGIEMGKKKGFKAGVRTQKNRANRIDAIKQYFNLTDTEIKKVLNRRDFRLMTDKDFEEFLVRLEQSAQIMNEHSDALNSLMGTLFTMELRKVENLQEALNLPKKFTEFTTEQLRNFENLVSQYEHGDEFLSVRVLETLDLTDMRGMKTKREVTANLEKETGKKVSDIGVSVKQNDKLRWDVVLAGKNPLYKLMVEQWSKALVNSDMRYSIVERKTQALIRAARRSRFATMKVGERIKEAFIPADKNIFMWLESGLEGKQELAQTMTRQELTAALYIQGQYARMRDYLVLNKQLDAFREDYITHIRRGFLEAWSDASLKASVKELLDQYKLDEAVFTILDQKTGNILPLEKFFQFSMERTGGLVPTKNVARAFLTYTRTFERKAAMDSVIPKLYTYAKIFTREQNTQRGLVMDDSVERFVKEWINAKKGRVDFGPAQGSVMDRVLRAVDSFTILHDLGLNIPVGLSAQLGEQTVTFINIGAKRYGLGIARLRSEKGLAITRKYEEFVGRTPYDALFDMQKGLGEKFYDGLFSLFKSATVRANKVHLLGSLTKEELNSGTISPERLSAIRLEMGRYRVIEGGESIWGKSTVGGILKRYKAWAVAPMNTTVNNLKELALMIKKEPTNTRKVIQSREFQELFRATVVIALVSLIASSLGEDDPKDKSFLAQLRRKAIRDSYTIIQSLDPSVWGTVRMASFIEDLSTALSDLIRLEEYSKNGDKAGQFKGDDELIRVLVPTVLQ